MNNQGNKKLMCFFFILLLHIDYLLQRDFWIKIQLKQLLDKKKNILFKK
jgi:hypothetical protein